MKKIQNIVTVLLIALLLFGCGNSAEEWQKQYDLGTRYLSEENYEEAIIAFTAAIEIDAKRVEAYVGRGQAHIAVNELDLAKTDFEKAIELDDTSVSSYQGLAEVQLKQGDMDSVIATLQTGYDVTGDVDLQKTYERVNNSDGTYTIKEYDAQGVLLEKVRYDTNGNLLGSIDYDYDGDRLETIWVYDELNRIIRWEYLWEDGSKDVQEDFYHGDSRLEYKTIFTDYDETGVLENEYSVATYEYNEKGDKTKAVSNHYEGEIFDFQTVTNYEYDEKDRLIKNICDYYDENGVPYIHQRLVYNYQPNGKAVDVQYLEDLDEEVNYSYTMSNENNEIEISLDDYSGKHYVDYVREYDSNGDLLRRIKYDKMGNVLSDKTF